MKKEWGMSKFSYRRASRGTVGGVKSWEKRSTNFRNSFTNWFYLVLAWRDFRLQERGLNCRDF